MSWINKRIVLFFLALVLGYQAIGQEVEISLLTCDPGKELYSSFGHSAIRVKQEGGQDLVFNFGTFDFDTPNFYGKFTTGKLNYMLSLTTFDRFIFEYDYYQRAMREQVLDLNSAQNCYCLINLVVNWSLSPIQWMKYMPLLKPLIFSSGI